jgi:hypothetical protein
MGDGHHGWAASEIVSAFRDSFLWEDEDSKEFRIFAGIRVDWFDADFKMTNIPTSAGNIDLKYKRTAERITIKIKSALKKSLSINAKIIVPFKIRIISEGLESSTNRFGETEIPLIINSRKTVIEAEVSNIYSYTTGPENN